MKRVMKNILSLLLSVSALCILFAFQASALTTNCPDCGAPCDYNPMPFDLRHECVCPTHGAFTEEDCEDSEINGDCTQDWSCLCGNVVPGSQVEAHQFFLFLCEYDENYHYIHCGYYSAGCNAVQEVSHTFVNGVCGFCGYHQ